MKQNAVLALIVAVSLGGAVSLGSRAKAQEPSDRLSRAEAHGVLRRVGTHFAVIQNRTKRFPSALTEVVGDPEFRRVEREVRSRQGGLPAMTLEGDGRVRVKDYTLSAVVSAEGQSFQLRLMPDEGCGAAYFLGDSFVIYDATALGCEAEAAQRP
jgi:hypothetical protein